MKNKLNILIPNATSPRNLGDKSMYKGMMNIIKKVKPNARCIVHSVDPHLYQIKEQYSYKMKHTFYSWAVLNQKKNTVKIFRTLQLLITLLGLKRNISIKALPINHDLKRMLNHFKEADIVFFAGGGYLRSKKGLTQSLNLLMQSYPFIIASLMNKKIVVGPISYGPFAYNWHEKIVISILKKAAVIAVREEISYELLKKHTSSNLIRTTDFAFFIKNGLIKKQSKEKSLIGLTLRKWFEGKAQYEFENKIIMGLKYLSKKKDIIVQPIVQVNAPMYGDIDAIIASRVSGKLKKEKVKVAPIASPTNVKEALRVYGKLDMLIGMRMHSNILASISGVPFVGISYEHKTNGIAKKLGLGDYVINSNEINEKKLSEKMIKLYTEKTRIKKELLDRIKYLKKEDIKTWQTVFKTI